MWCTDVKPVHCHVGVGSPLKGEFAMSKNKSVAGQLWRPKDQKDTFIPAPNPTPTNSKVGRTFRVVKDAEGKRTVTLLTK
jgi:hypothetical protein